VQIVANGPGCRDFVENGVAGNYHQDVGITRNFGRFLMQRFSLSTAAIFLLATCAGATLLIAHAACAQSTIAESIETPTPIVQGPDGTLEEQLPSDVDVNASSGTIHIFPAVLMTRRYGPVEEPAPEFYTLRNAQEPGFDWTPGLAGAGWGWGGFGWSGWGWGGGYAHPGYGFGLVGYNRYYSRPWYTSPAPQVWSNKFPWYSPGGLGPNIYQPWYLWPNRLPWYTPYGIGPNIYQPWYTRQSYYPWYSPYGSGPNIYTPTWQYQGCFYW
jgi:hypothetical protein